MDTVHDIMYYALDGNNQYVQIWDTDISEVIWEGYYRDMPTKYDNLMVGSWDLFKDIELDEYGICFNIYSIE